MKTILVVDDSPVVRQQVAMALKQAGFSVLEAVDGMDGTQKVGTQAGISMVVCDVNMPRMNGLEMLEKVSATRPGMPFLMLTTEGSPDLIQRAKKFGAKGWIIKPFKADLLVAAIRKLVG